jgi:hypothetical protein
MAVKTIAHHPEMTTEQAKEIFAKGMPQYKVQDFWGPFRDFVVVKGPFTGVALKLEQTGSETKLVYAGVAPAMWARLLLGGLIGFLRRRSYEFPDKNAPNAVASGWAPEMDEVVVLGQDGWELVSVVPISGLLGAYHNSAAGFDFAGFTNEQLWVFKRPCQAD